MERTEPVEALAASREELSRMLIGRRRVRETHAHGSFPRSNVMRFLMDPRKRGLWVAGATTIALLFPSLSRAGKLGALATLVTRVTKTLTRGRN